MAKGDILTAMQTDVKDILTSGGFQNDITFTSPDGSKMASIKGISPLNHVQFDTEGRPINSKNAHVTVVEADLIAAGYTTRVSNEVKLINHRVTFDSVTYIITENYHDDTLGIITCKLGKYGS